jgi:hypothetical protein
MSSSVNNKHLFFDLLQEALSEGGFLKGTLSKPHLSPRWKRIALGCFHDSTGKKLISFDYSDGVQTERKNLTPNEALEAIKLLVPDQFKTANIRLTTEELIFELNDNGSFRLKRRPLAAPSNIPTSHNREKNYIIPANSRFLLELGITTKNGDVRRDMFDKFRQVNKFVEVISALIKPEDLSTDGEFTATDFGSGKHYLTFALHSFLASRCKAVSVRAVEQRPELVSHGRHVAEAIGADNLSFLEGTIADTPVTSSLLVVALHACDTATDDALVKAVQSNARYICVAPCCHRYVRSRLRPSADLHAMLRHGIIEERFAEGLTDSLRVLALEALGYQAKLFEFISPEHTAKNVMITAVKIGRPQQESLDSLQALKEKFQLKDFYLDRALDLTATPQ